MTRMFANMTHTHVFLDRRDSGRLAEACQAGAFEVRLLDVLVDVSEAQPPHFANPANSKRVSEKFLQNSNDHVHKHDNHVCKRYQVGKQDLVAHHRCLLARGVLILLLLQGYQWLDAVLAGP